MPKDLLIKNAVVVTMDDALGELPLGDILIKDGKIAAVAPVLSADGVETIDATGKIALPGLIEPHNCLWQTMLRGAVPDLWSGCYYTHLLPLRARYAREDNFNAGYVAGYEALSYGVTTVVDYCHNVRGPGYAKAAIDGLAETGIRRVFTHSFMSQQPDEFADEDARFADARATYETFHDRDSLTTINYGVDSVGSPHLEKQLAFVREIGVGCCIHMNGQGEINELAKRNLLGPDLLIIHGNWISNAELKLMAETRTPICFTPSADVQATPADVVGRAMRRGVDVVFGADIPCHVAADPVHQLRIMFYLQAYLDGQTERTFGVVLGRRPPVGPDMPLLRPRTLFRLATREAARVLGLDDKVGSLTPGKRADVVLFDAGPFGDSVTFDPCAQILLQGSPRDVDTVIVDGDVRMSGGALVGFDKTRARRMIAESRQRILGA